ncbi:DUF4129 domain-containing protein [Dactylosporangium sp. NPDC051485]|uniref:DUF4129 domain-containing protein n=1 Tax=Dactylosporangium sp. NPDC051485 TaxID=3154846 RepID=UPI00342163A4
MPVRATDRTFSRWLPVLGVVAVLAVAAAAAAMSSPEITNVPLPDQDTPGPTPTSAPTSQIDLFTESPPADAGDSFALPSWVTYGMAALCVVLIAVLVGTLVYHLVRNRAPKQKPRLFVEPEQPKPMTAAAGEEVMAAVEAGLVELTDTDADPRKAVIACWVRLERAAAAAGTPRLVGDSPTELVTRLLSAHQVSRPTLEGFAEVYREARYATHPVGERSRHDAIAALRQIRAELSGVGRAMQGGVPGAS